MEEIHFRYFYDMFQEEFRMKYVQIMFLYPI